MPPRLTNEDRGTVNRGAGGENRSVLEVAFSLLFFSSAFTSAAPRPSLAGRNSAGPALVASPAADTTTDDQKVVFNTHTLKYHCASCTWAKRCTKNCITTTLVDAKARGGVPCRVCGGTSFDVFAPGSINYGVLLGPRPRRSADGWASRRIRSTSGSRSTAAWQ